MFRICLVRFYCARFPKKPGQVGLEWLERQLKKLSSQGLQSFLADRLDLSEFARPSGYDYNIAMEAMAH